MGEESGWGSALGLLPEIEVLEDLFNHRDDVEGRATFGALWYIMHYLMECSH